MLPHERRVSPISLLRLQRDQIEFGKIFSVDAETSPGERTIAVALQLDSQISLKVEAACVEVAKVVGIDRLVDPFPCLGNFMRKGQRHVPANRRQGDVILPRDRGQRSRNRIFLDDDMAVFRQAGPEILAVAVANRLDVIIKPRPTRRLDSASHVVNDPRERHYASLAQSCNDSAGSRVVLTVGGWKPAGSANATQRGWNGPNAEIIANLEVTREIAAGLEDFVKSATTARLEELGDPIEVNQIDERLEEARKQVASSWNVTQRTDADGQVLSTDSDPTPTDSDVAMSVGLLGAASVPWPRQTTSVRLPRIGAGEITELVCCRLTLGESSVSWLQRAPLDPPPGDERDRQALARYLDPRTFLLWIRSLLTGDAAGDGSGDWDDDDKSSPQQKKSREVPTWWAPTIEEVLKAWTREPASLVLVDKKVRHYLKIYQEQTEIEQTPEERRVVEEFYKTWNVLRRALVPETK